MTSVETHRLKVLDGTLNLIDYFEAIIWLDYYLALLASYKRKITV